MSSLPAFQTNIFPAIFNYAVSAAFDKNSVKQPPKNKTFELKQMCSNKVRPRK